MWACEKCERKIHRDFHEHVSYQNFTTKDLDQGLVDVDGGGTHAMLIKTECLSTARGFPPPNAKRKLVPENRSYPDRAYEVYLKLQGLTEDTPERELIDHYIGDLPDQSMTMQEEDGLDKPYFTMPKAGTEDMLWCYRMKCKGVQMWCDTDVFAKHVGFAPVVDRSFVETMENIREGKATPLDGFKTAFAPPSDGARDHGMMDGKKSTALI